MASQNLNVGTTANANDGDTLRAAFIKVKKMFAEVYGQTYSEQGDLSGDDFKIKGDKLQMTADAVAGDDGKVLTYDHASGGFTWETKYEGDIESIVAGAGLTGSSLDSGDASLNVGQGEGILVNADEIKVNPALAGTGLTYTNGVINLDAIGTGSISDDAVTAAKMEKFDDSLAATDAHVLVADGTDFTNVAVSGDATIDNTGALTIEDDSIGYAKLDDEFTTSAAIAASAVDFSSAAIFTKTITATTTLTFSNVSTGMVKTLVISGDASLAMTGVTTLSGTYDGSASKNVIQIISTNGSSEMFATISNVA
jgi:hypothetical protein